MQKTYKPAKNDPAMMASNLSFNKSIAPSPALMSGFARDRPLQPVLVQRIKGRGAFLNSPLSKDLDPSKPNIFEIEMATLPAGCDTLRIDFSVNVTAGSIRPNSCELPNVEQLIGQISRAYAAKRGYHHLAERYVWRLLNGSVLWRNYTISTDKKLTVAFDDGDKMRMMTCQCRNLSPTKYAGLAALHDAVPDVDLLIDMFAKALGTDGDPFILNVTATGIVGDSGEVYPSQVFSERSNGRNSVSREFVSHDLGDGRRQGKMNATKIGNAIRHIDEWHGYAEVPAIAVEVYGTVQHNLSALRPRNQANFYNLLWQDSTNYPAMIADAKSAADIPSDIHYFMAVLIRGGVFAAAGRGEVE